MSKPAPTVAQVKKRIQTLSAIESAEELRHAAGAHQAFADFLDYLNEGKIRAAEPVAGRTWRVNAWVKDGIVRVGFRLGQLSQMSASGETLEFSDKDTLPIQDAGSLMERNVRIVPGGSSIRAGSYIGKNVVMMPPAYINIGAYVDDDAMIDSLTLVGSCAQVGKRVHVAAGAIIGGVLEPANAAPCIVEDDAFMGAYSGIFNGVSLGAGAVLTPKTVITDSIEVWEALAGQPPKKLQNSSEMPIRIPDRALVVPGSIQLADEHGKPGPISKNIAIIRGYYQKGGNAKLALNELLRKP